MAIQRSQRPAPRGGAALRLPLALVLAGGVGACTTADPDAAAILHLVEAMAGVGSPDSVEVVVGGLPRDALDLPDLPDGDRIVGSVVGPGGARVLLSSTLPADSVGAVYGRRLTAGAWRYQAPPGGLRASGWSRETFCRPDGDRLTLIHGRTADGSVEVEMRVSPAEGDSCPDDIDATMGHTSVPPLLPPEGVHVGEPCPGDRWEARATPGLVSGGGALGHYRSWMEATPWRPVEASTPSVARSWTRVDSRDRPIRVTLAVTGGAGTPDCRALTFSAGLHR